MEGKDHTSGKKGYIKWKIVMLTVSFQNCQFVYNILFLCEIRISIDQTKYYNNFKWLGMLAT